MDKSLSQWTADTSEGLSAFLHTRRGKTLFILLALLILFWRRPGQFLYPYIWAEDASDILIGFMNSGWKNIFEPVAGYYITIAKLINFTAYKISFWYYPTVAAGLAVIFQLTVLYAIAYSPTTLKYPLLCALSVLFIKTDPECFNVALYSFWWAGLLLILATLWPTEGTEQNRTEQNRTFMLTNNIYTYRRSLIASDLYSNPTSYFTGYFEEKQK